MNLTEMDPCRFNQQQSYSPSINSQGTTLWHLCIHALRLPFSILSIPAKGPRILWRIMGHMKSGTPQSTIQGLLYSYVRIGAR